VWLPVFLFYSLYLFAISNMNESNQGIYSLCIAILMCQELYSYNRKNAFLSHLEKLSICIGMQEVVIEYSDNAVTKTKTVKQHQKAIFHLFIFCQVFS